MLVRPSTIEGYESMREKNFNCVEDARKVVGPCPRARVFNVIVSGHVFGYYGYFAAAAISSKLQGSCEACHSRAGQCELSGRQHEDGMSSPKNNDVGHVDIYDSLVEKLESHAIARQSGCTRSSLPESQGGRKSDGAAGQESASAVILAT